MAWIEGITNSERILKDLMNVFCTANKNVDGDVDPAKNWELIYPASLDLITNRAVVRTTTTPAQAGVPNPYGIDNNDEESLSMYVEFYMPEVVLNVETGIWSGYKNYYYFECRMFDVMDEVTFKPKANIYDAKGNVATYNSHCSEWARFSWYRDYTEQLKDSLDTDGGTSNIEEGLIYDKIPNLGVFGTVGIEFYCSVDNDKIAMVLVGDPTVDFDNYLISFGYIGKIESFEGSINDTAGNFALTVSSSVIPCWIQRTDSDSAITDPVTMEFPVELTVTQPTIVIPEGQTQLYDSRVERIHKVSFKFLPYNDRSVGDPLLMQELVVTYIENFDHLTSRLGTYNQQTGVTSYTTYESYNCRKTDKDQFKVEFANIPPTATRVKVFMKKIVTWALDGNGSSVPAADAVDTNWYFVEDVAKDILLLQGYIPRTLTSDHSITPPVTQYVKTELGVVRDPYYGSITNIVYPTTWGLRTATGVSDISMYQSRNCAYFQQHFLAFITPEQTMQKDAFNPSRWTGKFHMSPAYVVQGYDGYRGMLKNVVVVDDSSIIHLDKLIVNKDSVDPLLPEETYRYFKVNAPFSCLTNSPNFHYGIAIKEV